MLIDKVICPSEWGGQFSVVFLSKFGRFEVENKPAYNDQIFF